MFQIQNITSDPKQRQNLVLPDGTAISVTMAFVPMQLGWFFTEISYLNFTLNGIRICNSPDLLYQYRNEIPFGIACFSATTAREPTLIDDFRTGSSKLYILTEAEVDLYTEFLSGQI